jgi:hypothetical protein
MLTLEGFSIGDTLDITNLDAAGASLNFYTSTEIPTITKGATTIELGHERLRRRPFRIHTERKRR